jgi:diphthamide synthase (EF-2-diphthine--ammonia ligase)
MPSPGEHKTLQDRIVAYVDPVQRSPEFPGREYDAALLVALPPSVARCGERGEFHTFCYGGPIFAATLAVRAGERFVRDGCQFADVVRCE